MLTIEIIDTSPSRIDTARTNKYLVQSEWSGYKYLSFARWIGKRWVWFLYSSIPTSFMISLVLSFKNICESSSNSWSSVTFDKASLIGSS